MEREKVGRRPGATGGLVAARDNVLQEVLHELAAGSGDIGTAHAGIRQGASNGRDGVVVQAAEVFDGTVPVGSAVGLIPHLPVPLRDFLRAVTLHAVFHPLVNELGPLGVVLRWIRPAAGDQVVREAGAPRVLVGLGGD